MTPANVREFLDRMQARLHPAPLRGQRYQIDEPAESYEEILRGFFQDSLENPSDRTFILLWLLCLELSYADVTESVQQQFGRALATMTLSGDGEDAGD